MRETTAGVLKKSSLANHMVLSSPGKSKSKGTRDTSTSLPPSAPPTLPPVSGYDGETNAEGKMHGQGTYVWSNGNTYSGEWSNDMANGRGIFVWANGTTHAGEWRDNRAHGEGLFTTADGQEHHSVWDHGDAKTHATKMLHHTDLLGKETDILWERSDGRQHWHRGKIAAFDQNTNMYYVEYQDGDSGWHDLARGTPIEEFEVEYLRRHSAEEDAREIPRTPARPVVETKDAGRSVEKKQKKTTEGKGGQETLRARHRRASKKQSAAANLAVEGAVSESVVRAAEARDLYFCAQRDAGVFEHEMWYARFFDDDTKQFCYFNTATHETLWSTAERFRELHLSHQAGGVMGGVESDLKRAAAAAATAAATAAAAAAAGVASSASLPLGCAKEFAKVHTPDHVNKKKIWLSQGTQRMLGIEGHLHGKKFVNHHGKGEFEGSLALVDGRMVCVCVG